MRFTKLKISKVLFVLFSIFSSSVFSQIIFGPELVNSTNGDLKTFVYNLSLGDNLPGTYLLKLQNGSNGPALLQQCQDKPTIELKRQCQYENLVDRIENQLTRLNTLNIIVNGVKISSTTLLNKSASYLEFPIQLGLAENEIKISVQGNPEAFANVQIEELATTDLAPRALFSINSNYGRAPFKLNYNAAQSFDPLNKIITYEWFVDDTKISDLKSGSYIFENPGESTLKLKVTNSAGLTSELSASIIILNPLPPVTNVRPVPKIVVSYPDPMNLRLVKVSALDSYDPDGFIVKTEINFGDTVKVLSNESLHQYANDGTFLISVRVTDNLGLVSAIEKSTPISQNTQLSRVSSLYGPNTYYGSFSSYNDYLQTINVPAAETAELYRIKIKNADGKDHLVRTCSGTVAENIMCAYNNLLSKAYIALYRVDYANIYLNNIKITDSTSINKNQKSFQTYLKLSQVNQLKIRLKGWPTAYVDVEVEKLGQVPDTTAPVLSSNVDSGTTTRSNLVHIAVEDNSNVSTEIYQNDVLVATEIVNEFDLTLQEGVNNFVLKSKDAENNVAQDFILSNITLDSTAPVSTPLDLKAKYIFTSLPQIVTLNFSTNEPLSSATANGETLVQISPTQYQYQIKVFDQVRTTVQVRFKDLVGNEGVSTYYFLTEIDTLAPVLTMSVLPATTKLAQLTAAIRITEKNDVSTSVKVNGQVIATSALKSFNQIIPLTNEGINTIEVISVDSMGNISNIVSAQVVKDTVGPVLTLNPTNNTIIAGLSFTLSGTSNEPMTQVLIGGKTAILSTDKMSFTYNYVSTTYGVKNLAIQTKDILGNLSTIQGSYSLQNASVPIITSNIVNGSTTNNSNIQVNVLGNGLSNLKVILDGTILLDQNQTSFSGLVENDGVHTLEISATNVAGTTTNQNYSFTLDKTPPFINLSGIAAQTTMDTVSVNYNFWDMSAATFRVVVDQVKIYESTDVTGSFDISLLSNGLHTVTVSAIDIANNMSEPMTFEILKDNSNPVVTIVSPADGDYVNGYEVKVKAQVDDSIQSIRMNGQAMYWNDTEAVWEVTFVPPNSEDYTITVEATNNLNLVGSTSIVVKPLFSSLVPALLGLYEDAINNKTLVKGAAGSTRPFMSVKIKTGIFSSETVQADKNGSFMASMDINDEYTVIVNDPLLGQEYKHKLTRYMQETILSGVVKDNNDMPMQGVAVRIGTESNLQVTTNEAGIFEFKKSDFPESRITGDQVITIDGTTLGTFEYAGRWKKFPTTTMNVSLSYKQNNIIQKPIYLYPIYLDAPMLAVSGGGTITSPDAPGVELNVGANVSVTFPSGSSAEPVTMFTVDADKITVAPPSAAMPEKVVVLEPSGAVFNGSVELKIPNSSNFPPKTSMFIMLFNSRTGKWEAGGAGRVSDDGASVVTKEDQGIRHFSIAYAMPAPADIMSTAQPDKQGADSFTGAVTNQIQTSTFKVLGQKVSPALIYKSSWAKPSTTITNIFNIPDKEIIMAPFQESGTITQSYAVDVVSCMGPNIFGSVASSLLEENAKEGNLFAAVGLLYRDLGNVGKPAISCAPSGRKDLFYQNYDYSSSYSNLTAKIEPKKVDMTFISADIKLPTKSFKNIPNMAQLSQFVELKNEQSQYLNTGIYPYIANYKVYYDKLVTGTVETKYFDYVTNANVPDGKPELLNQRLKDQWFGTDLIDNLFVQNYRNSSAGQGWKIAGTQRIVNPNAQKIMIEESDGSIATYSLKNAISTVADMNQLNTSFNISGDLTKGVALNMWPDFVFTDNSNGSVKRATLGSSQYQILSIGSIPSITGNISGYTYFDWVAQGESYIEQECVERYYYPGGSYCNRFSYTERYTQLPKSTCKINRHSVSQSSKPTSYLATQSGAYVLDGIRNNLSYITTNQYTDLVSQKSAFPRISGFKYQSPVDPFNFQVIYDEQATNNWISSSYSGIVKTKSDIIRNAQYDYFGGCGQPNATVPDSSGEFYAPNYLNSPSTVIQSIDPNILLIASSGSNSILAYNITNSESSIIAGGLNSNDDGDNLLATKASIAQPQGLVQDHQGNLYISTAMGHIRKIDTSGTITTIAGDALNGKLLFEGKAKEMLLDHPYGLAIDNLKNILYIADTGHNRILKMDLISSEVTTIVGTGQRGFSGDGSSALDAQLDTPTHIFIDQNRNLIITDSGNNRIRSVPLEVGASNTVATYISTNPDHSELIRNVDGTWERRYRNRQKEVFDSNGNHVKSISINNLEINYEYQDQKISKVKSSTNQEINYTYSGGLLSTIIDVAGKTTQFDHNNLGQLTRVIYPDQTQKQYTYDSNGLMIEEINQKGLATQYIYNEFDRLEKTKFSNDNSEIIINDSVAKGLKRIDGVDGLFIPTNVSQEKDGVRDANGNIVKMAKDVDGFISSITDPRGRTLKIKRDISGRPIELTDVDGSISQSKYDDTFGDLIESNNLTLNIKTLNSYNVYGQVISTTDPYGKVSFNEYNEKLLLVKSTNSDGKFTTYNYNSLNLPIEKSSFDSNGILKSKMVYEYDSLGRMIKQSALNGKFASYTYDAAGNILTSTSNVDASNSSSTFYEYDSMNRLKKVTSPKNEITEYQYSPVGELLVIIDPKNKQSTFQYDLKGQLVQKTDPDGATWSMTYDANGNVLTETDPNNQIKVYSYNEVNKPTQVLTADDLILYSYNLKDELISISNQSSSISLIRDAKQRITSESVEGVGLTNYPRHTINYGYMDNDLRIFAQSSFQTINYSYDQNNYQLTQISNSFGNTFNFNYDGATRLVNILRPGSRTDFTYDIASVLESIRHSVNGNVKNNFEFQYDDRNFITQKRSPSATLNYSYDKNGQIVSSDNMESSIENEVFQYDSLGNRISYNGIDLLYDNSGQKIQDDGSYTYLYDNNGNILAKNSKSFGISYVFEYSALNQIKKATVLSAPLTGNQLKIIEYKYDPSGRRIIKLVQDNQSSNKNYTKKFYYDGDNIFAETDINNNLVAAYTHSPLRPDDVLVVNFTEFAVAQINNGVALTDGQVLSDRVGSVFYLKDHLGTVTDLIDQSGNVLQKYHYSAFGKLLSLKSSENVETGFENANIKTTFTFTGRELESELGLYYYRARFYDPSTGRFLQQDPDPGKLDNPISFVSKYIYVANNPIMNSDPSGKFWLQLVMATISGVVNGLIQGSINKNGAMNAGQGEHADEYFWNGFWSGFGQGFSNTLAPGFAPLWNFLFTAQLNLANQQTTFSHDKNNGDLNPSLDWGGAVFNGLISTGFSLAGASTAKNALATWTSKEIANGLGSGAGGFAGGYFGGGIAPSGIRMPVDCNSDNCLDYQYGR